MQGTQVQFLVWEDSTYCRAAEPMCHNYWAHALESRSHNPWAYMLQLLKPVRVEPVVCNKRNHHNEKPTQPQLEKACMQQQVQFSHSVVSDFLRPHELQHARPPCPSPTPGVHSDSRPSSPWYHSAISSSVIPFTSCPQSLPASESFPMRALHMKWPKYRSFTFSIMPSKEIPGLISFRMDWLDLLAVQGTLKSLLQQAK